MERTDGVRDAARKTILVGPKMNRQRRCSGAFEGGANPSVRPQRYEIASRNLVEHVIA